MMTMATYTLVSRAQWNARPPESTVPLDWKRVTKFVVHYSGGARTQTVRSIQDYCMDSKGHSDIDYNMLVRGDLLYVGRGNNVGSHTLNNNSSSYGICVIGRDGDATDADFYTVRKHYDELCARIGKQLTMTTHRGVLGTNYTSCPGDELAAWVAAGMPYPNDPGVQKRKVIDMWFLQVTGQQAVYVSDGIYTRNMPAGTYETTIKPLTDAGVPFLFYATMEALLAAGGPTAPYGTIDLPEHLLVTLPETTVTVSLSTP